MLVLKNKIILTAENTVLTNGNPIEHAEINLLNLAHQKLSSKIITQSTIFCSTEPCVMCKGAIYWSGIRKIVYGCSAKSLGKITEHGLEINSEEILLRGSEVTEISGPHMEEEAIKIHQHYWPSILL